ncbi:hypothetical protein [Nocardioides convexus]|uniref:hypothetical protein n=1 Tax=Nocardioides convexus TaxID=2712224 RepID=UPI002418551E|nr:hypothetical protein [Nocardioides convexus]
MLCPGSQNDVSVHGDILVLSVDSSRSNDRLRQRAAVGHHQVVVGGHPGLRHQRPDEAALRRRGRDRLRLAHPHDRAVEGPPRPLRLRVVVLPQRDLPRLPAAARPDQRGQGPRARAAGRGRGEHPGPLPRRRQPGGGYSRETSGCHDLTAYARKDVMAGACMGDGILLDISDRERPVVTERVRDTQNFAFWHSATFNNAGTKVVFTDETRRGRRPDLQPDHRAEQGRGRDLRHPRRQSWSSAPTSRSRGPRPTPRTAWPTTAR